MTKILILNGIQIDRWKKYNLIGNRHLHWERDDTIGLANQLFSFGQKMALRTFYFLIALKAAIEIS